MGISGSAHVGRLWLDRIYLVGFLFVSFLVSVWDYGYGIQRGLALMWRFKRRIV